MIRIEEYIKIQFLHQKQKILKFQAQNGFFLERINSILWPAGTWLVPHNSGIFTLTTTWYNPIIKSTTTTNQVINLSKTTQPPAQSTQSDQ